MSDTTKSRLIDSLRQETTVTIPELLSNTIKFTLLDSLRQDSNAKTEFNVLSNTAKPTLLESLSQESDYVVNALSNTTKPILLKSLCQEPEFIENTLSNATKPTLLESLSQDYASLGIENEILSYTIKFILLDSLRLDSDGRTKFNVLSNTTKPTLLESLCQEPEFVDNTLVLYKMDW